MQKRFVDFRPKKYEQLLQSIVKEQINKFIEKKHSSYKQSGLRNKYYERPINYVINEWKTGVDQKKSTIAVFLDFRRDFVIIDRERLLTKLENMGICGNELQWFNDYLNSRK